MDTSLITTNSFFSDSSLSTVHIPYIYHFIDVCIRQWLLDAVHLRKLSLC